MLASIIKDIIATCDDVEVVDEAAGEDDLLAAAVEAQADVILLGKATASGDGDYREVIFNQPRRRIVAIAVERCRGYLIEIIQPGEAA